jgi:hypothetical protein
MPPAVAAQPVVITDVVTKWPAFGKWDMDYLVKKHPDVVFRAGPIDLTLDRYWKYASQTKEDAPLYLFDKQYVWLLPWFCIQDLRVLRRCRFLFPFPRLRFPLVSRLWMFVSRFGMNVRSLECIWFGLEVNRWAHV